MCSKLGRILSRLPGALSISTRPSVLPISASPYSPIPVLLQGAIRNYANRKGTRERKIKEARANRAAKLRRLAASGEHIQKQVVSRMKSALQTSLLPDESKREEPTDNVYTTGQFRWPVYDVRTAINNFKEVHHPTMFDNPRAMLKAYLELDLSTKKKTQFVDNVSGVVELSHIFDTGKPVKTICLICKDLDLNAKAIEAGAEAAVGLEGLKMFQEGDLDPEDFDVILAHPDVVPELAPIRGLISKKFPNIKKGTVGFDVVSMVKKFKNGVDYSMSPNATNPKLGVVQVPIGMIDMELDHLVKNFSEVVEAILTHQPANASNEFITRGALLCAHSNERFLVAVATSVSEGDSDDGEETNQETSDVKKAASG